MRKIPLLLGLLACTALTGCDWWHKPAPPQQVTCHCTAPAPMASAPVDVAPASTAVRGSEYASERVTRRYASRRRHYRHYARHHRYGSYRWHKRQAERSVDIYGYSSSSRSYGAHGYAYGYGAGHGGDCCGGGEARYGGTTRVWADGYGRRHVYDTSAVRHYAWQAHMRRRDEGARLDPWHGYDDDWN